MRLAVFFLTAIMLLAASGCGAGGPAKAVLHPVSGKVTVGGKPPVDCNVQFVAVGKEGGYTSRVEEDGKYSLVALADGRPGAEAGKYKVVFTVAPRRGPPTGGIGPPGQADASLPFPKEYSSAESSPKEVEVKAESNTINIEIP